MSGERVGHWKLQELLAVGWSADMAARFPNVDHTFCRQQMVPDDNGQWGPADPVRCMSWHCNRCGASTDAQGGHNCPDRPPVGCVGEEQP